MDTICRMSKLFCSSSATYLIWNKERGEIGGKCIKHRISKKWICACNNGDINAHHLYKEEPKKQNFPSTDSCVDYTSELKKECCTERMGRIFLQKNEDPISQVLTWVCVSTSKKFKKNGFVFYCLEEDMKRKFQDAFSNFCSKSTSGVKTSHPMENHIFFHIWHICKSC